MMTATIKVEWRMIDTPTRRAVLGAGVFAAGSLIRIDSSVAQAPLPPTPACHDGDKVTLLQTEGLFFMPSWPDLAEFLVAGMAGLPMMFIFLMVALMVVIIPSRSVCLFLSYPV